MKAYAAYYQQRRHIAKIGIASFQVLTVTEARLRAERLAAEIHATMSTAQRRACRFLALDDLTTEGVYRNVTM